MFVDGLLLFLPPRRLQALFYQQDPHLHGGPARENSSRRPTGEVDIEERVACQMPEGRAVTAVAPEFLGQASTANRSIWIAAENCRPIAICQ
jgi:hypothetical protein